MRAPTVPVRSLNRSLPKPIGEMLGGLDRRVLVASLARGLGTTALVASIAAALGMAADFLWVLPPALRWANFSALITAVVIAFSVTVVLAILRRPGAFDLAAVAERAHPGVGELLTGAVDLLGGKAPSHGSPKLIAAVADRAAERVEAVEPSRVIPWRKAGRRLAIGLGALWVLAAPIFVWPETYGRLARHFLMPWGDVERPGRHVLEVSPGDCALPVGADLTVSASVRSRLAVDPSPGEAWLLWSAVGERTSHRVAMPAAAERESPAGSTSHREGRHFEIAIPRLARSITYHVESGSVKSPRYTVSVVEPPAIAEIQARVEPPAYTKRPAARAADPTRIEAFEGSRVTFEIKASRAVRSIEVEWPVGTGEGESAKAEKMAADVESDERNGSLAVEATRSGPYAVSLCDELGIKSRADLPRRVIVRADAPPVVAVRGPEDASEASPKDTLGLAIAARDDVAVASVELHYTIEKRDSASGEGETGHIEVALPGLGSRSARGSAALALGPLAVKPGDSVSYRVRVADNRPAPRGPNVVWSPVQTLSIVASAEPLRVRASRARAAGLHTRLESLKKDVAADRQQTELLRQEADAVRRGDDEWDDEHRAALAEREAATRTIEDQVKLLSRDLDQGAGMRELSREAHQVAAVEAEAARAGIEQAGREADAAARHASLEQAVGRLAALGERLEELTRKADAKAREAAEMNRLDELAKREEDLAAAAQETNGDRASRDRVEAEQQAVRNELDALLRTTPALRGLVLGGELRKAERLAGRVRELAEQEREEARRTAEPSKQAARLKELAELQRELENDARKLGVSVAHALTENGRGRFSTERIQQPIEPIERGEMDAGRERLELAELDLRRFAREIADVPDDPKALAIRLFRRQDVLNRDIDRALQSVAGRQLTDEDKRALAARLKPLEARQRAIAELARTIKPPDGKEGQAHFPHDAARDAAAKTVRAAETLPSQKTQEITDRKNDARQALERLANEMQDSWRRQEPTRQRFADARRQSNEVAEEIARNMRETDPRPDRPATTAGAAAELAARLNGTADKQAQAVAALEAMEPEPRAVPQQQRALRRAQKLAAVLRDLRDAGKREQARALLRATELEAHVAMDRLELKLSGQTPADDLAQELADDARATKDSLAAAKVAPDKAARARAAEAERSLAAAIRNVAAPDAAAAKEEAVRLAERAANVLEGGDGNADAPAGAATAMQESAAAAQALADQLADRPQALAKASSSPAGVEKAKAPVAPKPSRIPDPELAIKPEHADRAGELARRQRRIKERFQAILGERAGPQQTIRKEAVALGQELKELHERVQNLSGRAAYLAQEAANHVGVHTPSAVDQAVNNLAGGRAHAARDDERRAAAVLGRGAELAEDAVAALRSEMVDGQGAIAPDGAREQGQAAEALGDARDQMHKAAQELEEARRDPARTGEAGAEARQAMHRAARDLLAAAELTAAAPAPEPAGIDDGGGEHAAEGDEEAGLPASPAAGTTPDPRSAPGAKGEANLTELKTLIRQKTGRAWGELPGHLRNEILQMQAGRYRDDYARIIQLYFREIAAEAGARENVKP